MRRRALLLLLALLCPVASDAGPPGPTGPAAPFAGDVPGPEGLAFTADRHLVVGTKTGEFRRYAADGTFTSLGSAGEPLAGVTVLRDGRILGAALAANRIWAVGPTGGTPTVFASDVAGPNFIVQTRRGHVLASASIGGTIVDVTDGTPVVRGTALSFPNGLALGPDRFLYVAETGAGRVSRLKLGRDDTLGPPQLYAGDLPLADGLAFDRAGNLLVLGNGTLKIVVRRTRTVVPVPADPLVDWASNLAFGRGGGFGRHDLFLANFGPAFGDGTTVVRLPYDRPGARLIR